MKDEEKILRILGLIAIGMAAFGLALFIFIRTPQQRYRRCLTTGRKYLNEMKYDEAVNMYRKAVSIEPKQENAYIGLGQTYTSQADSLANAGNSQAADITGAYDKAADAYQKVIDLDQKNTDGYYYQAEVYTKAGDAVKDTDADLAGTYYTKAVNVYKQIQTLDNNQAVTKEMTMLVAAAATPTPTEAPAKAVKYSIDANNEEDIGTYGTLTYPVITVTDSDHAALGKALGGLKDQLVKIAGDNQNEEGAYDETMTAEVMRNDGIVFSVVITDEHTYDPDENVIYKWGFNYDAQTGELLTLDDIFKDTSDLFETATQEYVSSDGEYAGSYFQEALADVKTSLLYSKPIWWLTDQGFIMNTEYEDIGAGEGLDLPIPYGKYRSMFQEKYLPSNDTTDSGSASDSASTATDMDYDALTEQCLDDAVQRQINDEHDEDARQYSSSKLFDFTGDGTDDIIIFTGSFETARMAYCYACDTGTPVYADALGLRHAGLSGYQHDLIVSCGDAYGWYVDRYTWNGKDLIDTELGSGSDLDTEKSAAELIGVDDSQIVDLMS
ncbi:MAG: tetratricopeptide repeat protein [Chordicoccus sp.]